MAKSKKQFAEKLEAITRQFAGKVGAKIDEIETASERLFNADTEKETADALDALFLPVHRISGSAGSFGFPSLSETAASLEGMLRAIKDGSRRPSAEELGQVSVLLKRLRRNAATPPDGAAPLSPIPLKDAGEGLRPGKEKLVFVVEGDAELAEDMATQLSHFGYEAEVFNEASGAALALKETLPAAMILDPFLPEGEMAGIKVLADIRESGAVPPPAIVLSARDDLISRLEAVRAGAHGYFNKPVDMARIVETLDELTSPGEDYPFRVLIVDDDRALAELYALLMEKSGLLTTIVTDPMKVMEPLIDFGPDLILMDIKMPGCDGIELATVIRQKADFVQIPIVFLTANAEFHWHLRAIRSGGDDFLTKPVQPDLLVPTVIARAKRARLFASLISRDSMTMLANNSKIKQCLDIEIIRAKRQNKPLSFAMIDLDKFKSVNDTHGHWAGDAVIKALAQALRQRLRKTDIAGRYGGEEFAVILPDTAGADALEVLDDIREGFGRIRHVAGDAEFYVSFSCGIATVPPVDSPSRLTIAADESLYEAKHQGRNRVVLASRPAAAAASSLHDPIRFDSNGRKRLKFFIVDDDPEAIGFMTEVLKAEGHSVSSNCAAAYSLFEIRQQKPDCVLTDLAMAEMDGLEFCKELRSKRSLRNIKIIVVSVYGDET